MNVSAICEVGTTIYTLFTDRDGSLSAEALELLGDSLAPQSVQITDFTKKISGKRLFCLFGDEAKVASVIAELDASYTATNFKVAGTFHTNGLQCGLSYDNNGDVIGTANYPITDADLFKFAEDINTYDGNGDVIATTAYLDFWNGLSVEDKKKNDPFWRTSDFNDRILV